MSNSEAGMLAVAYYRQKGRQLQVPIRASQAEEEVTLRVVSSVDITSNAIWE